MTIRNASDRPQRAPGGTIRQRSGVTVAEQESCYPVQTITLPRTRGEWSQSDFVCFEVVS